MNAFGKRKSFQNLFRSKSMCSLPAVKITDDLASKLREDVQSRSRKISDSSVEIFILNDSDSEEPLNYGNKSENLSEKSVSVDGVSFAGLEQKIDMLNDIFRDQCRLLTSLKEDTRKASVEKVEHAHNQLLIEIVNKVVTERYLEINNQERTEVNVNGCAKSFLDAIEIRQGDPLDQGIRDALTSFLQSEELRECLVSATAREVREVVAATFSRDLAAVYLPVLHHSHRRLVSHVTSVVKHAFIQLEARSASFARSIYKTSKILRQALQKHQSMLESASDSEHNVVNALQYAVDELLQKELKEWRQKVIDMISSGLQAEDLTQRSQSPAPSMDCTLDHSPISPLQTPHPKHSIIDQLMLRAVINKQMEEGDVNGAFATALSAADLGLVVGACRAAAPRRVFAPCRLRQPVLLSLVQQLATDMLHDTHLKCRYLEEAIICLNVLNPETRTHLPLVVGEVRKYLQNFLKAYPSHVAAKRITLIIMAATNLLK